MTTEERIEKLEHDLANTKRRNRWILTAAAVLVLVGLVTAGNVRTPDEIKARRFIVVNAQGNPRAMLSMGADGSPALFMLDAQGRTIWSAP